MHRQTPPVFLNLLQIRFPIAAIMSILHRFSGVLLFLSIPVAIYSLQLSLSSEAGFLAVQGWLTSFFVQAFLIIMLWALLHHLFAGIRFLLLDIDIGISRTAARRSAWWVNVSALLLAVLFVGLCQ